ncbi:MAG: hypothetical protein H7067_04835 [Burkholderiales bacterium]|nr:hypothetical protein [Opitutaceae bacterium]
MPSATITLKVSAARKKALQAQAKRAKKSLNAYLLERVETSGSTDWEAFFKTLPPLEHPPGVPTDLSTREW